jgi:hypothetical protein
MTALDIQNINSGIYFAAAARCSFAWPRCWRAGKFNEI